MSKKNKLAAISGLLFVFTLLFATFIVSPAPAYARPTNSCDPGGGGLPNTIFVPWYHYLEGDSSKGKCSPKLPTKAGGATDYVKAVSLVALAVIDTVIRLSSLIAVGFLIYGSIQYITSQGEPQGLASAKSTIANALIGLVIVLVAVAVVQFIGNGVRGT